MRAPPRAARFPLALALLAGTALAARATEARDELLRLVPDDVALCLVLNDLRGQGPKINTSAWAKRLRASPLFRTLADSPEVRQAEKVNEVLRQKLDVTAAQLAADIFGDAVVLAYRVGPPDRREGEQGLVLLRARDAALLARLVQRVTREQRESGEGTAPEPRDYRGLRYYFRKKGNEEQFYFQSGPFLALAGQEALLRQVLDRRLTPAGDRPDSRALRGLRGTEKALLALWLNPRAFDRELKDKAAATSGPNARLLEVFRGYWRALDDITLGLSLAPEPVLRLTVRGRPEALPPAVRRLIESAARPTELWERFPREAILTMAGRTDFAAQDQVLSAFLTPEEREASRQGMQRTVGAALGLDLAGDVLPRLGPDWGLCVAEAPDRASFPHVLYALRIRPGPEEAPVDQAVFKALQFFAGLAVFEHNRTHKAPLRLKGLKQGDVEVKYLSGEGALPPGLEPAFALKEGYLLLASSPAAVARFGPAPASPPSSAEVPLLRVSFRRLARVVQDHREALAAFLAEKNHLSAEAAGRVVDGLLQGLRLADRLDLSQRTRPGEVAWTLRLHVAADGDGPSP